ncbi:MAG: hypothetical protein NT079_01375, partial [Candidatus Omnitrophica bacterium]|nr:hypothetical protein [Candidatus Omnitrophota bacterium]
LNLVSSSLETTKKYAEVDSAISSPSNLRDVSTSVQDTISSQIANSAIPSPLRDVATEILKKYPLSKSLTDSRSLSYCEPASEDIAKRLKEEKISHLERLIYIQHAKYPDIAILHAIVEAEVDGKIYVLDTQLEQFEEQLMLKKEFVEQRVYSAEDYYHAVKSYSKSVVSEEELIRGPKLAISHAIKVSEEDRQAYIEKFDQIREDSSNYLTIFFKKIYSNPEVSPEEKEVLAQYMLKDGMAFEVTEDNVNALSYLIPRGPMEGLLGIKAVYDLKTGVRVFFEGSNESRDAAWNHSDIAAMVYEGIGQNHVIGVEYQLDRNDYGSVLKAAQFSSTKLKEVPLRKPIKLTVAVLDEAAKDLNGAIRIENRVSEYNHEDYQVVIDEHASRPDPQIPSKVLGEEGEGKEGPIASIIVVEKLGSNNIEMIVDQKGLVLKDVVKEKYKNVGDVVYLKAVVDTKSGKVYFFNSGLPHLDIAQEKFGPKTNTQFGYQLQVAFVNGEYVVVGIQMDSQLESGEKTKKDARDATELLLGAITLRKDIVKTYVSPHQAENIVGYNDGEDANFREEFPIYIFKKEFNTDYFKNLDNQREFFDLVNGLWKGTKSDPDVIKQRLETDPDARKLKGKFLIQQINAALPGPENKKARDTFYKMFVSEEKGVLEEAWIKKVLEHFKLLFKDVKIFVKADMKIEQNKIVWEGYSSDELSKIGHLLNGAMDRFASYLDLAEKNPAENTQVLSEMLYREYSAPLKAEVVSTAKDVPLKAENERPKTVEMKFGERTVKTYIPPGSQEEFEKNINSLFVLKNVAYVRSESGELKIIEPSKEHWQSLDVPLTLVNMMFRSNIVEKIKDLVKKNPGRKIRILDWGVGRLSGKNSFLIDILTGLREAGIEDRVELIGFGDAIFPEWGSVDKAIELFWGDKNQLFDFLEDRPADMIISINGLDYIGKYSSMVTEKDRKEFLVYLIELETVLNSIGEIFLTFDRFGDNSGRDISFLGPAQLATEVLLEVFDITYPNRMFNAAILKIKSPSSLKNSEQNSFDLVP